MVRLSLDSSPMARRPLATLRALIASFVDGDRRPLPEGYYRPHSRRMRRGGR